MPPLAPGSLVVVIGLTGYIASHIGLQALQAGYRVRGTVRSIAKGEELRAAYEKEGVDVSDSKLTMVALNDLASEEQLDAVFAGADGVIHPALPDIRNANAIEEIITSTIIPLKAAAKAGVKRFVLTGTVVAAAMPEDPALVPGRVVTDKDWNDFSVKAYEHASEEMKASLGYPLLRYAAGKVFAERQAWEFMEVQSRPFELTVILPAMNWGPKLFGPATSTLRWLASVLQGDPTWLSLPPHYLVDVRDDAKLHVLSLTAPEASGRRLWAAAQPVGWNRVLAVLRRHFPNAPIPADRPEWELDPGRWRVDNSLSEKLLGGRIDFEKCIVDAAKSLGYESDLKA